jgi:hypothetical protein
MTGRFRPLIAILSMPLLLGGCAEDLDSPQRSLLGPVFAKGGGNPGKPGAGDGGKVATVALGGTYATAVDQVVGLEKTGKALAFEAVTENKIDYTLDLPPYGGDLACVSSGLAAGESAADLWTDFVATQNVVTSRSFLFAMRLDDKIEGNRTSGIWSVDGVRRHFHVGTTPNALGDDVNASITLSTEDGNDVYTLTGGALQILVANGLQDEKRVTCPNSGTFVLTVRS